MAGLITTEILLIFIVLTVAVAINLGGNDE